MELGEALPSEQDELQGLLSNYSFTDASLGVVALAASVYYFGVKGENDVNVLTLLAVAVVAGLNQEVGVCQVTEKALLCDHCFISSVVW